MNNKNIPFLREKANNLPMSPGVYFMKDDTGKIIYVGKAKHLKNRVTSYFTGIASHPRKVYKMVANVENFDIIVTNTEMEALVLECSQIKHYLPKYNILLKDDKNFPYIKVTLKDEYPRIVFTRKQIDDRSRYFGPYSGNVWSVIETVQKTFKIPSCTRNFPKDIGKGRPCLNYFIKTCMGVCSGKVEKAEYDLAIASAMDFLDGKYEEIARDLKAKMERASEELKFEEAAICRDQISQLDKLKIRQRVLEAPNVEHDVIAYGEDELSAAIAVFCIRGGKLINNSSFILDKEDFADRAAGLSAFMKQYYEGTSNIPREILLSDAAEDAELLSEYFTEKMGRKVYIKTPQKGELKKAVDLVMKNTVENLRTSSDKEEKYRKSVTELAELLGLDKVPAIIEAIDISNTGNSEIVGGLICFENGRPQKSRYRRYKIRTTQIQDDYASMKEVVQRRFKKFASEEELPDLLLLDGGVGHLSTTLQALAELGVSIPVFGMVKDDKHRSRGLVGINPETGESLEITPTPVTAAAVLIANMQEEVHRYAIAYHRSLRGKKNFASVLTDIEGIGESRARALLMELKTLDNIKKAGVEELSAVKGMTEKTALAVKTFFEKSIDQSE